MNLVLRIFLIVALLWAGAMVFYIGIDNITISNIMYLIVSPIGLFAVFCVAARYALRNLAIEEKKPETVPSKVKPKSAMELYALEKARKEQESAMRDMVNFMDREQAPKKEATLEALQKKKAAALKKTN